MAVEAVVSVVIQKLTDMLIEEPVVFDKVIDEVEEIRIELRSMRGFLIDAEENQGRVETVKKLADKYLGILYQVEDIIETFALGIARRRRRIQFNTRIGELFSSYAAHFSFNNLMARQKLRRKMARIRIAINDLSKSKPDVVQDKSLKYLVLNKEEDEERAGRYEEEQEEDGEISAISARLPAGKSTAAAVQTWSRGSSFGEQLKLIQTPGAGSSFGESLSQPKPIPSFSYDEEQESGIVGLQEEVNALVQVLTADKVNGSHSNILSIYGQVGSGKTTLAQAIYKSKAIKTYFEHRSWVFVSKDYSERDLLLGLLKQVGSSKDHDMLSPEQGLLELLGNKKCLVVIDIDDAPSCEGWDELKYVFANTKGSKIIIITSDKQFALLPAQGIHPYNMKKLRDDESWNMFSKKARFREILSDPPQDQNIFQLQPKIQTICKGLPLRIALLGGLLSTKRVSCDEWSRVLNHIHGEASGVQTGVLGDRESLAILLFCYNDLAVHSKLCLLYLVLFPKGFDIPVRRLIRLWLAEGFVKRSPTMIPEDVAEEHFDDLVKRNLIQISKWRSDGSPRRCRLPGALHDYLQPKTQDISLFHVHRNSHCNFTAKDEFGPRRIVEYQDIRNCQINIPLQSLRSYISFNLQKKDIPAREVASFIGKITGNRGFALLTVLDLEGVYKPTLPDKLGDLVHLRYLGLRWTFLDSLPPSVGDLHYLETLDLKRTYINKLPPSIWKLKHLRHLNLNEIRLDMPQQPPRASPLTRLLSLWGLFVDDKSPVKNSLSTLRDLRELGITFTLSSSSDLTDWISKLTSLRSLRLRSKDEMGRPSKLHLEQPLSRLGKLSHLNLLGHLPKLPAKHDFPPGLKVLTLSVSRLDEDPMPVLGQLPGLTVLRLLADSYRGKRIVCPLRGFGELKVLKLWMLKDLEEWEVKEGAMKNLKELNIRCCQSLRSLPPSLLPPLEKLTLTSMPKTFVDYVREQKSEHTHLIVNKWDFTPLPWEQDSVYDMA